jgi:hypothetical protein
MSWIAVLLQVRVPEYNTRSTVQVRIVPYVPQFFFKRHTGTGTCILVPVRVQVPLTSCAHSYLVMYYQYLYRTVLVLYSLEVHSTNTRNNVYRRYSTVTSTRSACAVLLHRSSYRYKYRCRYETAAEFQVRMTDFLCRVRDSYWVFVRHGVFLVCTA